MNLLKKIATHRLVVNKWWMGGSRMMFCSDDDFKRQTKIQVTNENAQ